MVPFMLKTIGVFFLLLPFTWNKAGGVDGIRERAGTRCRPRPIGVPTIITLFVVYSFGMLVGQDIWQRVFTARSPEVPSGAARPQRSVVCSTASRARSSALPRRRSCRRGGQGRRLRANRRDHPAEGISGIVLAAAVAAMMSTASGALIATATVASTDVAPGGKDFGTRDGETMRTRNATCTRTALRGGARHRGHRDRGAPNDVVNALTIAYDILVGGLWWPSLAGSCGKRHGTGAAVMAVDTVVTLGRLVFWAPPTSRLLRSAASSSRTPSPALRDRARRPICCRCGTTGSPDATPPPERCTSC